MLPFCGSSRHAPHFCELSKSKPLKLYGDEAKSRCEPHTEKPSQG